MARFVNLDGSGPNPPGSVFRWAVVDRLSGRRRRPPDGPAAPVVKAQVLPAPAAGEPARLTWLGHASWLVQLDGASLLIDPVFSDRIARVVPRKAPVPID